MNSLREIEHASSVLRFAADLNIELIFSRMEWILEINELHTVTKEVIEGARAMSVLGQA